ncbi:hypothetical protein [Winogradskyella endarachnes]|uniref:Uncharacterized protein n=1 Tax=Winogradskyella endarachnes TaxID=2681965 RepID=A0A6L6UBQ3_9FLAO|nr:hypothetical protein [Winogradskyella endarachnes]MUU78184.1 hypothetical protein [Winogradskyella endarachnes]
MESIFRTKKEKGYLLEVLQEKEFDTSFVNSNLDDKGIPKGKIYALNSKLHFSPFKGYSIKELIEINFNYFTWLPHQIKNFQYHPEVIKYARTCLKKLEQIDKYSIGLTQTSLGKAINQVNAMISYENAINNSKNEYLILARKSKIDVKYYQTIVNTPLERLIRQSLLTNSNTIKNRRTRFETLCKLEIENKINSI